MVTLSILPSLSVSSKILTRSLPLPGSKRGYSSDSTTQKRPLSSIVKATGFTKSGSHATTSTVKPSGTFMRLIASAGV